MKNKIVSKKAVVKSKAVSGKKGVKAKVVDKKKKLDLKYEKWAEENSLVSEKNGNCLISFPIPEWDEDALDGDLGLLAALWLKKIHNKDIYIETVGVWDGGRKAYDLIYEFDKEYTKEIKATERDYFAGKIKTDVKTISDYLMFEINYLSPKGWREGLINQMKRIVFEREGTEMHFSIQRTEEESDQDYEKRIELIKDAMADLLKAKREIKKLQNMISLSEKMPEKDKKEHIELLKSATADEEKARKMIKVNKVLLHSFMK